MCVRMLIRVMVRVCMPTLRVRVLLVAVGAVDNVRGHMAMDQARDNADDDNAGEEETDEAKGRGSSGETGAREILLRGGEHAVQRGKELRGQLVFEQSRRLTMTPALRHSDADRNALLLAIWKPFTWEKRCTSRSMQMMPEPRTQATS